MNSKSHRAAAYRRNELATARHLVMFLRGEGETLSDPRPGDPNDREPDALVDTPDGVLGIECVNGYYDESEAAWLWEMALETEGSRAPRKFEGEVTNIGDIRVEASPEYLNPSAALREGLQRALDSKCSKTYSVPTIVVLNARHAPLATADDGPAIAGEMRRDPRCSLRDAYVCLAENFTGVVRFFRVATPGDRPDQTSPVPYPH